MDATHQLAAQPLIACHECDLLQREPAAAHHCNINCSRCGAALFRNVPDGINRTIALALAGLMLFFAANIFPFLSFEIGNQSTQTTLFTGVRAFYFQGTWVLATLVFITSILAPLLQLLLMLYVFVPLKFGRLASLTKPAFRALQHIRDWNMIEVFMIGILVALVKLTKMAVIVPGIAMWSFVALIFLVTGAHSSIDARIVWQRLERAQ